MNALVVSTYAGLWITRLDELLDEYAAAGFRSVELLAARPHVDLDEPADALAAVARARRRGLAVTSVVPSGVDVNLASTQAPMRAWSVAQFVRAAVMSGAVGAPWVVVHPGRRHPLRPPPLDDLEGWVLDGLEQILLVAEREGVRVLLENVPTGLIDTAAECLDVVQRLDGRLGICYDVANGHVVEDVAAALDVAGPALELVHVSDTTRDRWRHDPVGRGDVPFAAVIATLQRLEYDGPVVLETLHDPPVAAGFAADVTMLTDLGHSLDRGVRRSLRAPAAQ